jgi:tetrahydromethanopterin S-methyltransferase subunit G
MNILNVIPMSVMLVVCSCVSYWHGNSKCGGRKIGLAYTIILGIVAMILSIAKPMFA